ncbi:putative D-amino acid oxidase [Marinobacterium zhoushanense]|uniref:D-amino acid oxidase n=1 Tax=Marinobacterium zhoushanense TaxID=1679163 RepID=A0ABQ1KQU8_9GAMM|nr:glycine oxidase ThiO [Marinobacterium zhoushanense]GGC03748.1 putative D-amino acid oxidase [Marinobacterium zhoushanense]
MKETVVVGAGVIGLMTARELARSGVKVTLIERGVSAHEASWAGGGIVSPLYPWRHGDAITRLALWSQSSYTLLAQELCVETGCDPELRQKGILMVDVQDEAEALRWGHDHYRPLIKVDAEFIHNKEPRLNPDFTSAMWMPEVASIRNPRLGRALRISVEQHPNIELVEQCEAQGFILQGERIQGVRTSRGEFRADATVIAGGAWSAQLIASLGLRLPVEPVRGQMMVFKAPVGLIDRIVMLDGRYLIPRNDGRILVGSTLEHVGFDKGTTDEARDSLHQTALKILPDLAQYPVEYHWAGLRPGSPEGIPFIGAVPGYNGLYLNCGHYRNGLVLAPASTRLLSDILLERSPVIDPAPYAVAGRIEQE